MKRRSRLLSILLSLALAVGMIPAFGVTASAADSITNLKIDANGVATWDAFPGAAKYSVENINLGSTMQTETKFYFKTHLMLRGFSSGDYELSVSAYDSSNHRISSVTTATYTYTSKGILDKPVITKWDGIRAEWNAVPNATEYRCLIWNETLDSVVTEKTTDNTWLSVPSLKLLKGERYSLQITAENDNGYTHNVSDLAYSYGWYDSSNPFAFTSQPKSGQSEKTQPYSFSWETNYPATALYLQVWNPLRNDWQETGNNLILESSSSVRYIDWTSPDGITKCRLYATFGGSFYYSDEFTVTWTDGASASHSVTASAGSVNKTAAKTDETVSLTAIPGGSDFTFDSWNVISGGASVADRTSASATFTMPDSDVKISGSYKVSAGPGGSSWSGKTNPFLDVSEGTYFYDPVLWAYYASPQVTNGIDETHFGPASTVTRGQCVAFLWRAMGEPEPTSTTNPFVDVPASQYYYKPVLWAVEKGITKGTDASHFSPDQKLSTAHIITFLYRTLGKGSDGWYEEAGNWAKVDGLLDGTGLGVSDQTDCPRGAVVTFLYRELADTASGVNELGSSDFLMYVEESYDITGRGRVVTGRVQNGSIRTGDKVTLISCDESTKAPVRTTYTVEGIEMFHKLLDEARKGDNVGILLSAATGTKTPSGSALVNEGSPLKSSPGRFVGTFKRNSDHATKTLTLGDTFQVYWSGYDVTAMLVDLNGGDITPDTTREGVKLTLISPAVFYVGQELTIREGGRTYGTFTVTGIE